MSLKQIFILEMVFGINSFQRIVKMSQPTVDGDKIVGYIPGRMTPNADLDADGNIELSNHIFTESYLGHQDSLNQIIEKLKVLLPSPDSEISQWTMKDEIGEEGEKDYRITVKHIFDNTVLDIDDEVYPFNTSKYLYQVPNPLNPEESVYVKASFGGTNILDADAGNTWENQIENHYYKLQGTDPAEYIEGPCKDPALFEIISHTDINTAQWRVDVKNIETNEIQPDVYPFNLNGSLYKLDSGEFVLASCGGTEILNAEYDTWDNQKEEQFYKLDGTDPAEYIAGEEDECKNAPYKADHFIVEWDFAVEDGNREYIYYANNPQEMGARLAFRISAIDNEGYMFTEFDNGCYGDDVNVTLTFDALGEKSLKSNIQYKDDNSSLAQLDALKEKANLYSFSIKTSDFVNGSVIKEAKINFDRAANITKQPMKMTITDINASLGSVVGNDSIDKSATFIYARANGVDHGFARGYSSVGAKVYYEVHCNRECNKADFGINGAESETSPYWYIVDNDYNLDYSSPYALYNGITVSKANNDYIQLTLTKSPPHNNRIYFTPKDYLLFDKYNANVKTHSFLVIFQ